MMHVLTYVCLITPSCARLELTPWVILIFTPYALEEASKLSLYVPGWDSDGWVMTGGFPDKLINSRGIAD